MVAVEQAVIRYPEMRAEVVEAVRALSDLEYQQRVWVRRELPHPGYHDDFRLNVHILYDDTTVFEDPATAVGDILRGEEEVRALMPLKAALDAVFAEHGTERTDEEYLGQPGWAAVLDAANKALAVLVRD